MRYALYIVITILTGSIVSIGLDRMVPEPWFWFVMPPACFAVGYFGVNFLIKLFGSP